MADAACIIWEKALDHRGYGKLKRKGKMWGAHRWAWTQEHGPIPTGMYVLHKCDTPACINVDHLFLGTQHDNMRDKTGKGRHHQTMKTHCPQGHPYDEDNTVLEGPLGQYRRCRHCRRERDRARRKKVAA